MAEKKKSKPKDPDAPAAAKKAPGPGKRYFLATMSDGLIKDLKHAAIADDKSASECLEIATREWLERRKSKAKND
jgi:hypothetical protein